MTLPEAEVNQPSQPPLSIFSLGEGKPASFIVTSFTQTPALLLHWEVPTSTRSLQVSAGHHLPQPSGIPRLPDPAFWKFGVGGGGFLILQSFKFSSCKKGQSPVSLGPSPPQVCTLLLADVGRCRCRVRAAEVFIERGELGDAVGGLTGLVLKNEEDG